MQYTLYKMLKMQFDIVILINREIRQKIFKKVVDIAGFMWYYNQAVTKTATEEVRKDRI